MSRASFFDVTVIVLLCASGAWAGLFGPSQEEVELTLQTYFNKTEATLEDFFALDLSSIESDRHARVLAKVLNELLDGEQASLDAKLVALEAKGRDVERYFDILYGKEIRDALWMQTRPAKQQAYWKAYLEHRQILDAVRDQTVRVRKGEDVFTVLKRIAKRFKEVEP